MTTDTAVRVTKLIIEDKIPFEEIKFIDRPEIANSQNESLIMNFRFIQDDSGLPIMVDKVKKMLLDQNDFDFNQLE